MAMIGAESMPTEVTVWDLCEKFHWTLEYVEDLPLSRWHEYIQIQDGRAKGNNSLLRNHG